MIVSKKNINNSSNNDESVIEETENVNEPIIKEVEEIIIDDKIDYSSEFEEINKKLKEYEKNNTSFSELALNLIALKKDIDEICNKAKTQNNFDIIKDSAKELKLKIDFTLIEIHNNFMDTVLNMEYEQSYKLVKNHFNELEKITNKENDYVINNMYLDINPVVDNYKTVYHNYHHAIIEDIVYDFEFLNIFDKNNQEIDPLYEEVEKFVIETQSASISLIQRKFQISRLRAGKIMDVLEDNGVVSSDNGTQSRIVYKH